MDLGPSGQSVTLVPVPCSDLPASVVEVASYWTLTASECHRLTYCWLRGLLLWSHESQAWHGEE